MSTDFNSLKVAKVVSETADAKSIYFKIDSDISQNYNYDAGQYLTLKLMVDGEELRRAYSICTSPLENVMAVTVKRVPDGRVSNFVNDHLKEGDTVEVMPPNGKFTISIDAANKNSYYFFAGGSGITPMMSLIKTILQTEKNSICHLFYGCRDEDNIIFEKEFEALLKEYPNNLSIRFILSHPKEVKAKGLSGMFGKKQSTWSGWSGFMTRAKVQDFLKENTATGNNKKYAICGPSQMMDLVNNSLLELGIPSKEIMIEYFSAPILDETKDNSDKIASSAKVKATLKGVEYNFIIDNGSTIFDAMKSQGVEPPFSCLSGTCSTCVAKVIKGATVMDENVALDDDEVSNGMTLTCQAHPTTDEVVITYDI